MPESMKGKTLLKGHTLPFEGKTRSLYGDLRNGPGVTHCSCGEHSPELPNTAQRQRWHREHKQEVLDARNR